MMQFIVLGQIPGTHFQLTFIGFQVVLALVIAGVVTYAYYLHSLHIHKEMQRTFDIITLQTLGRA
jgi:Na+/H+ antiporter NhaC